MRYGSSGEIASPDLDFQLAACPGRLMEKMYSHLPELKEWEHSVIEAGLPGPFLAIEMTRYTHQIPVTRDEQARVNDDILIPTPISICSFLTSITADVTRKHPGDLLSLVKPTSKIIWRLVIFHLETCICTPRTCFGFLLPGQSTAPGAKKAHLQG